MIKRLGYLYSQLPYYKILVNNGVLHNRIGTWGSGGYFFESRKSNKEL
jgi:hypothetical protein